MKFKKEYFLHIFILSLIAILLFDKTSNIKNRVSINEKDSINIFVNKVFVNRGFTEINKKYFIPNNTNLISKKPEWIINYKNQVILSDIKSPYKLIKLDNSKEIYIIKYQDTLTFELPTN